jgi:PAS domain S-box-containing protein
MPHGFRIKSHEKGQVCSKLLNGPANRIRYGSMGLIKRCIPFLPNFSKILPCLLFVSFFWSEPASLATTDPKVVRVGSEIDFPPYAIVNEEGKADGFSVELIKAVAGEVGLELQIKAATWSEVRGDLEKGKIDVLPFVAWSLERDKVFDFTSSHVTVYDNIFRRKNDSRISSESDLKGKVILVMEGDSAHDYLLKSKLAKEIQVTKTLSQALLLLNAGVADAVLCERVAGLLAVRDLKMDSVEALPEPISAYSRSFSFAVKEGNSPLLAKLEQGLAAVRINGEYQRIYDKWLQSVNPSGAREVAIAKRHANISFITAVVAVLFGSLAFIGLYFLGKALKSKNHTLSETKETFNQILDAIPDLILVKGPDSRIVWANRAFREYYGMSLRQLKDMIDAPFSPPDNTKQYVKDDCWVYTNAKPLNISEESLVRHDGTERIFNTIKVPLFDSSSKVYRTVGVSRDITDRIRQEQLIADQRNRIVSASKMSALGEMAGGIAHEINNPLAVIVMKAQQLLEMAEDGGSIEAETVGQFAKMIDSTAQRISAIVKALKSFARDGSSDPFSMAPVKTIVNETLELCREKFRNHEVQLKIEGDLDVATLECRPVQIGQILLNLLSNAFDVVAKLPDKWVCISVKDQGDYVEFSVTDSGPPIPPAVREKIMRPFFTTKEIGKGTGLGLSISKGLAESHNGTLCLDQSVERTRFVLHLPKSQKNQSQKSA